VGHRNRSSDSFEYSFMGYKKFRSALQSAVTRIELLPIVSSSIETLHLSIIVTTSSSADQLLDHTIFPKSYVTSIKSLIKILIPGSRERETIQERFSSRAFFAYLRE
jgi:hypothetical protein